MISLRRLPQYLDLKRNFIIVMLSGSVLLLFMFTIYPFIYNMYTSLTNYFLLSKEEQVFVGLRNYLQVLQDPDFWAAQKISLYYVVGAVTVEVVLGFFVAYLLNEEDTLRNLFLAIILLPLAATPVAISFVWRIMFNADMGVFNYLLGLVGLPSSKWAAGTSTALPSLILVDIWQWTPFVILILLAGLMSLPGELFEAAEVDGATRMQVLRYVTIPLLKPAIVVVTLLRLLDAIKVFDTIYVITGGGPVNKTQTLNVYTYLQAFKYFKMGYAATLAVMMLVILTIVATILVRSANIGDVL